MRATCCRKKERLMIFCSLKEYIHTLHERTGNGEGFVFFLSHTYKACPRRVAPHRTEREPRSFTKATTAHAARTYKKKYKPPPKKRPRYRFLFSSVRFSSYLKMCLPTPRDQMSYFSNERSIHDSEHEQYVKNQKKIDGHSRFFLTQRTKRSFGVRR